jgi:hypothetical protein
MSHFIVLLLTSAACTMRYCHNSTYVPVYLKMLLFCRFFCLPTGDIRGYVHEASPKFDSFLGYQKFEMVDLGCWTQGTN